MFCEWEITFIINHKVNAFSEEKQASFVTLSFICKVLYDVDKKILRSQV